ncbi:unnamed protein product [Paramecium octaurelia]|uniref:Uncharacterized protein n=1 Tax=Paramecium octaurelia TaxID=43137 RepID=A0A8S1YJZ2_PAROT|nr:unnamed protein product [Paramecium octaurelia]
MPFFINRRWTILIHIIGRRKDSEIQLMQQDWSEYIRTAREDLQFREQGKQRKSNQGVSLGRNTVRYLRYWRNTQRIKMQNSLEILSDADSVKSQRMFRKMKIGSLDCIVVQEKSIVEKEALIQQIFNQNRLSSQVGKQEHLSSTREYFPRRLRKPQLPQAFRQIELKIPRETKEKN